MKIHPQIIVYLVFTSIFTGCATYTPPNIPNEKMAQVRETEISNVYINITSIDGIKTDSLARRIGFGDTLNPFKKRFWVITADDVFEIKPGRRILDVTFDRNGGFAHGQVIFVAEAGRSYHVTAVLSELEKGKPWWKVGSQYVFFEVKDDETGQIVSDEN